MENLEEKPNGIFNQQSLIFKNSLIESCLELEQAGKFKVDLNYIKFKIDEYLDPYININIQEELG